MQSSKKTPSSPFRSAEEEICDYFNSDNIPIIAMPTTKLSPVQGVKLFYLKGYKPIISTELVQKGVCILLICVDKKTFSTLVNDRLTEKKEENALLLAENNQSVSASSSPTPSKKPMTSPCAPSTFFSTPPTKKTSTPTNSSSETHRP